MRIYPAAGGASMRRSKTGKDVVLGGGKLVVPAGVALHMPITAVHHNEAIWENAKAFIPERFLEVRHASQASAEDWDLPQEPLSQNADKNGALLHTRD